MGMHMVRAGRCRLSIAGVNSTCSQRRVSSPGRRRPAAAAAAIVVWSRFLTWRSYNA